MSRPITTPQPRFIPLHRRRCWVLALFAGMFIIAPDGAGFAPATPAADQPPQRQTRVTIDGTQWRINGEPTHRGSAAEGLLMNVRMVNSVFEDTGPAARNLPEGFDPDANTARFIEKMPDYVEHGVRAFTISLQGGMPGYEGAVNSAFNADGTLRNGYLARVRRVIEACDRHGVVVILTCFYQRQHSHERALAGRDAIRNAVANTARWVANEGFTNVVLEISNEYRHGGFGRWRDGDWLRSDEGQVELMKIARRANPDLLVSTSGMGGGRIPAAIAEAADYILIHFNNTALGDIPARIEAVKPFNKPIVCNEDNKIARQGAQAARASVRTGAGWGLMHSRKNQYIPFAFDGAEDDPIVYAAMQELTTPGPGPATGQADEAAAEVVSITLIQPTDGTVFPHGEPIELIARPGGAADEDAGLIVRFTANATHIGTAKAPPWRLSWQPEEPDDYDLGATLHDGDGNVLATSAPVDIEVVAR